MICQNKKKQHLLVFGLPRSGTTITCSFLNSVKNGFCISEPILGSQIDSSKIKWDKIDSEKAPFSKNIDLIIKYSKNSLYDSDEYIFGGIKEIWTPYHRSQSFYALESNEFDNVIFIVRDPIDVFASWKATTWSRQLNDFKNGFVNYNNIDWLIYSYTEYLNVIKNYKNSCNILVYEDFVLDPIKHISKCNINIEGEVHLKDNEYKLGDSYARSSIAIEERPSKRNKLNVRQIEKIKSNPIYKEYLLIKDQRNKDL